MGVLYPSALHNRFTHSLGVYYLGQKAFSQVKKNSSILCPEIEEGKWKSLEVTFAFACLLHDCAHSAFSHTFEHHYLYQTTVKTSLIDLLRDSDPEFERDIENIGITPHEVVSSIVAIKFFKEPLEARQVDLALLARMITGCKFSDPTKSFMNCLISLLNGFSIDVDKLDYILRDTLTSGTANVIIDVERLLSSLVIKKDMDDAYKLYFNKNALSVINNVLNGRNFLYEWIYSHHQVWYNEELIKNGLDKLNRLLGKNGDKDLLSSFFSVESFFQNVIFNEFSFYLPCDGDLWYILKKYQNEIPEIKELISRQYTLKPLWKTFAEFMQYFNGLSEQEHKNIRGRIEDQFPKYLSENGFSTTINVIRINPKINTIQPNEINILLDDRVISFSDLMDASYTPSRLKQYYYIPFADPLLVTSKKEEAIKFLRTLKA